MTRSQLIKIAKARISEANALLSMHKYSGAYYLGGYAVECLLKAAIAKTIRRSEFPNKKLISDAYTHDLSKLAKLSPVGLQLENEIASNKAFALNWGIAKDWSTDSRYEISNANKAKELLDALNDPADGVLQWLRRYT